MTDLLPCKKCGGPAKCLPHDRGGPMYNEPGFRAFCDTTGCVVGQWAPTEGEAIGTWNILFGRAVSVPPALGAPYTGVANDLDPRAIPMNVLDTFIASAMKELGLDLFLVLPENRMRDMASIMLTLINLKKSGFEPGGLTRKEYQQEVDALFNSREELKKQLAACDFIDAKAQRDSDAARLQQRQQEERHNRALAEMAVAMRSRGRKLTLYRDDSTVQLVYDRVKTFFWTAGNTVLVISRYDKPEGDSHHYIHWPRERFCWFKDEHA